MHTSPPPPHRTSQAGRVNNSFATGRGIVLDPREPLDDGLGPYRVLRHQPKVLFVEPEGTAFGHACGPAVPAGCIPITPLSKTVKLTLQHQVQDAHWESTSTIRFTRTAFPLADGNAVTDYSTQGMSFGTAPWLAPSRPPHPQARSSGPLEAALSHRWVTRRTSAQDRCWVSATYTDLTQHRSWADVRLVTHLWDSAARRQEVIGKFAAPLPPAEDKELVDEMQRLEGLAAQTAARYAPDVMHS